jgi:hypothetical protein
MHAGIWWGNLKERLLEDLGLDWSSYSTLSKRMPKEWDKNTWTGFIWLRMSTTCEHGKKITGAIKPEGFLY